MILFEITKSDSGKTIEEFLSEQIKVDAEKQIKKQIQKSSLRLNGSIAKKKATLVEGDYLECYFDEDVFLKGSSVVYEDDNLFALNKMQGISCYTENGKNEVYDIAEAHMKERGEYSVPGMRVPYLLNPIDKNMGGAVLFAKDEGIYEKLKNSLRLGSIRRHLKVFVIGKPNEQEGQFHDFITVNQKTRAITNISKRQESKSYPALTKYKLLGTNGAISLLEIEPVTNYSQQIYAQLAYHDIPIIGDEAYGNSAKNRRYGITHPAAWCYKIEFFVGGNNKLSYLDHTQIEVKDVYLPYFGKLETV